MADINRAFNCGPSGISLDDVVGIFTNSTDPSAVGETAPIGSLLLRDNGELYQKTGAGSTDWIRISDTEGTGFSIQFEWRFSTDINATDPTSGRFKYDNSTLANVTNIYISDTTDGGVDITNFINNIGSGSKFYIQQLDDSGSFALFEATGTAVDNGSWFTIPVSVDDSGILHQNNSKCGAIIAFSGGSGSGSSLTYKSFSLQTDSSGDDYIAGYYDFAATDANLNNASQTIGYGVASNPYAAHAAIVAAGAGSVNTGVVGLRVVGTSINDSGVRVPGDSDIITNDITTLTANEYAETPKKFLGAVTYQLFIVSGSPTTYSLDFNYGFTKYEDFGNEDFTLTQFEVVGKAGGNDANFNVTLYYHTNAGWTYAATGFEAGGTILADLGTDHSTDDNLNNGQYFAFKRSNLAQFVNGSSSEGIVIKVVTSTGQAVEYLDAHIGVEGIGIGGGGAGEANTASNVGAGGVGVFDGKVGIELQFRNINAGSNKVSVTDDAANNEIDIDVNEANVDHDALLNFVANEHVDHSGVNINSGEGLSGGGDITTSRTINLDIPSLTNESTVDAADSLVIYDASAGGHREVLISDFPAEANTASNVGAGGVGVFDGKVGADLQFRNINAGSNKVSVTDDAANNEIDIDVNEANVDHDALLNFVANEHIDHSGVNITAGEGLSGGGDITVSRTVDLDINGLTTEATIEETDFVAIYDVSAGGHRKTTVRDIVGAGLSKIIFPFTQETSSGTITPYLTTTQKTSDGWRSITTIPYQGSNNALAPTVIEVRARFGGGSGSYGLRVVDLDNGSAIIASTTGLINTVFATTNLGALSNIPTGPSNLEFQTFVDNANDRDIEVLWLAYEF
jgi:uncharacterized lipoprotein YehR (DUF1307 family)